MGVVVEQFLDPQWIRRLHYESGMVILLHAIDDLRIVVRRCIRLLLLGQRHDYAGIVRASTWKLIALLPCSDFELRPLSPQIYAGSMVNHIRDVRSPHTRRYFDE